MADFTIKAHDLLPVIVANLTQNGAALDLTTASSVKFILRGTAPGSSVKVTAAATVPNAAGGTVRYDWTGTDTNTPGDYYGEWEITWPGPKKQTVPTETYHTIQILGDLDNA